MTPTEMLALLGYRLEDPSEDVYTPALKVLMINRAQARVYSELNSHVVPELKEVESSVTLTAGAFDKDDLTYTLLGGISGGVTDIQLVGYDFTRKISFEEYKDITNRGVTFTTTNPKHYFLGSKCYVLPSSTAVNVYYKRLPLQITYATSGALVSGVEYVITSFSAGDDFTNVGAGSNATGVVFTATGTTPTTWSNGSTITVNEFTVASELVHDAVAFYAEALCWATNNDPREGKAKEDAAALIQTLNETITATDSNSIDEEMLFSYSSDYILPIAD